MVYGDFSTRSLVGMLHLRILFWGWSSGVLSIWEIWQPIGHPIACRVEANIPDLEGIINPCLHVLIALVVVLLSGSTW